MFSAGWKTAGLDTGCYTINSQTITLTFQVVNSGQGVVLAVSTPSAVVTGAAYRQTAAATPATCGNGSLSGGYGYVLTGFVNSSVYSDAGQLTVDGNGNGSTTSVANVGGSISASMATGSYNVASDCSGTATITNQSGTLHYQFAIVRDCQAALFFGTDSGRTVSGIFTPQFAAPQQSVVNGASFQPSVSPGSLFSIFGTGLSAQPTNASMIPLPGTLGGTPGACKRRASPAGVCR